MNQTKQSKLLAVFLTITMMVLSLAACGASGEDANKNSQAPSAVSDSKENRPQGSEEEKASGEAVKSDGYEKFSQLKIGMTESDVNAILGEPVRVDKAYYYYNVTVNGQDMEIEVWINTTSGLVTYLRGNFEGDKYLAEFVDSKTDLSAADKLDSGELSSYEDCVNAFKTPGYLITIDEDGMTRYLWVDSNEGHMCITFGPDGSVKSYVGLC